MECRSHGIYMRWVYPEKRTPGGGTTVNCKGESC